ncbi:MAG: reverse transcriptase/maturase family protein [Nanoarchaeota archaeon]|nr:reverse transcriptase/maturase family protein [Nanoarchaeota archaeon]
MADDLYVRLCSYENLFFAYQKARQGKTQKDYVIEFERKLKDNLLQLRSELLLHAYRPQPLQTFIIRDPKTRKISKSAFRDRIVHHALCNLIAPLFEKDFIYDSFANRKGKGTLKAIERFESFRRRASKNNTRRVFVLKADIKKYFENVHHSLLLEVVKRKVSDKKVLWLIKAILANHKTDEQGKGMPLGNLTSQFFANVYLNELDHYAKHRLPAKYYLRYVDDFVILHESPSVLQKCLKEISLFLCKSLALELHPQKSKIIPLSRGVDFLGMRIFPHHKLLKSKNLRKFRKKLTFLNEEFEKGFTGYDNIYDFLEGWIACAKKADTHHLRKNFLLRFNERFAGEVSTKEFYRLRKEYSHGRERGMFFPTPPPFPHAALSAQ